MKKITCVGYHATGSGAVDDFLREFNNIESANYGIESRFLQDPDGISDLEYNLIENPHRLNSAFAIKRFLKYVENEERTYKHIFGKDWKRISIEYIYRITDFKYHGTWAADIWLLKPLERAKFILTKGRVKLLSKIFKKAKKSKYYDYFPNMKEYAVNINQERFIKETKKYCEDLCKILNKENKEYVVLDQAVSPQNPDRYLRYIDDLKVIIVERDPRDVFINDIIINQDNVLPKDVKEFCFIFKASRKKIESKSSNILYINFEDMIYNYDKTTKQIMIFLGLNEKNHVKVKQFFNPEKSKKNTRLWEKYKEYNEEMSYIEKELKEYIYRK